MKIFYFYSEVFVEFTIIVIFVYHQFIIVNCCFIVLKMSKKQVQETKCVFIHVLIIPFIIFYCVRKKETLSIKSNCYVITYCTSVSLPSIWNCTIVTTLFSKATVTSKTFIAPQVFTLLRNPDWFSKST